MDASDNKSSSSVDIMAAVLSNMNKELPVSTATAAGNKDLANLMMDAELDDMLERSDNGDGSEKKDESTEKKGTNTSNETAGSSSCRDDSDVDIYVSASNKLIGYRYSVEEILEIGAAEFCKRRPEFFSNESFKVSGRFRSLSMRQLIRQLNTHLSACCSQFPCHFSCR